MLRDRTPAYETPTRGRPGGAASATVAVLLPLAPQSVDRAYRTRDDFVPKTSSHTACKVSPPAEATTGNPGVVSAQLGGDTGTLAKVTAPSVERAQLMPPVEVA